MKLRIISCTPTSTRTPMTAEMTYADQGGSPFASTIAPTAPKTVNALPSAVAETAPSRKSKISPKTREMRTITRPTAPTMMNRVMAPTLLNAQATCRKAVSRDGGDGLRAPVERLPLPSDRCVEQVRQPAGTARRRAQPLDAFPQLTVRGDHDDRAVEPTDDVHDRVVATPRRVDDRDARSQLMPGLSHVIIGVGTAGLSFDDGDAGRPPAVEVEVERLGVEALVCETAESRDEPLRGSGTILPPPVRSRADDIRDVDDDRDAALELRPQARPRIGEAGVQRQRLDLGERHPGEGDALRVGDHGFERLDRLDDHRRVRPEPEIEHGVEPQLDRLGGDSRLLVGLADRAVDGTLELVTRTARDAPGAAEVAPTGPMLQQHAALSIVHQESGCTEPPPVLPAVSGFDPGIPGVPDGAAGRMRISHWTSLARNAVRHPLGQGHLHRTCGICYILNSSIASAALAPAAPNPREGPSWMHVNAGRGHGSRARSCNSPQNAPPPRSPSRRSPHAPASTDRPSTSTRRRRASCSNRSSPRSSPS
ncbi:hypothetical protein PLANTIT3_61554 [Plantibacter sp. T3]|nr:hypothetical protein PLANTIT3_61554 [Plantibacter sp. T3]